MKKGGTSTAVKKPAKTSRENAAEKKNQVKTVQKPKNLKKPAQTSTKKTLIKETVEQIQENDQAQTEKTIKPQDPNLPRRPLIVFPK